MKKRGEIETLIRRLRRTLLLSGFLNGILLTLFFYYWVTPATFEFPHFRSEEPTLAQHTSSGQIMMECYQHPFGQLVSKLEEDRDVECGYRVRDFALACLVKKFYFDISKALKGHPLKERKIAFQSHEQLGGFTLYPGLTDEHYRQIISFAKTEKWPFTPEGLHGRMKQQDGQLPHSLVQAFMMTEPFKKMGSQLPKRQPLELLKMMLDVNWNTCEKALAAASVEQTLIEFLHAGSETAAKVLLESDLHYAVRKLDDDMTLRIFELLGETHPLSKKFARHLLQTPRGDDVWNLAKAQIEEPAQDEKELLYIVQEGDSLWKISRHFSVELDELKKLNRLDTDRICPGKILKIP